MRIVKLEFSVYKHRSLCVRPGDLLPLSLPLCYIIILVCGVVVSGAMHLELDTSSTTYCLGQVS